MTFGERLKELRTKQGWTQKEAAQKFGVSQPYYFKYEKDTGQPNLETLVKISETFRTSIDYLLKGDEVEKNDTFGSKIKGLRLKYDLTQAQLADRLEATAQLISNYERDYREPDFVTLIKLARIFKVTTDYLLGYEVEK